MTQIPLLQNSNLPCAHFSKWVHLDILLDNQEMGHLMEELGFFHLLSITFDASNNTPFIIDKKSFAHHYSLYIHQLKNTEKRSIQPFRPWFHLHWTQTLEGICRLCMPSGFQKLYVPIPTIQIKPICLQISQVDHTVRVSSVHPQGYLWGLRFSFPGMYQAPLSEVIEPINPSTHANALLFKNLRKWMRKETYTPSFQSPLKLDSSLYLRLGKQCSTWIKKYFPRIDP